MEKNSPTDFKKSGANRLLSAFLFFWLTPLFLPSWNAEALTLDWTGHSRLDAYYQTEENRIYGGYQLVLQPTLSASDDLNISGRVEIYTPQSGLFYPSTVDRSFGLPVFYWENGKAIKKLRFSYLFPEISQLYIDYKTELFQLQGGRSSRHFGLGITYNSKEDPFSYWISTLNQLFFYTEYGPFYIQPTFIAESESFLGLFQGGIVMDFWQIEAFYRYNTKKEEHHAEAFGKYGKEKWELRFSFSYQEADSSAFAFVFEGEVDLPWRFKPKIQLKSGLASKGFSFHPAYDAALLFQNYSGEPKSSPTDNLLQQPHKPIVVGGTFNETGIQRIQPKSSPSAEKRLSIQEGSLKDLIYFAPQMEFSFFKNFKVSPLILIAYQNSERQMNYEFDLQMKYKLEENFTFALKGGALYKKNWNLGILSQAAVTF